MTPTAKRASRPPLALKRVKLFPNVEAKISNIGPLLDSLRTQTAANVPTSRGPFVDAEVCDLGGAYRLWLCRGHNGAEFLYAKDSTGV
jgi:hypothetical protein